MDTKLPRIKYRSIFISDLHLGSRSAQPDLVCKFLREHDADYLYLVGDIIDAWNLGYWNDACTLVVRQILSYVKHGRHVYYILGNHDATLKLLAPFEAGHFHLVFKTNHITADGREFLVTHGDEFDPAISRWLYRLGDFLYTILPKRLSKWGKRMVKSVQVYAEKFRNKASEPGAHQGVICGHLHIPKAEAGYYNCGDWVEHSTALVEHLDGRFELLDFSSKGVL